MNSYIISWVYNLPFFPGIPKLGTTTIKAESEEKALQKFRDIGYPGISLNGKGYYRVEKIERGNLINYRV